MNFELHDLIIKIFPDFILLLLSILKFILMAKVPHQYVRKLEKIEEKREESIDKVIQEAASNGYTVKSIATTSAEYGLQALYILFEKVE